MSDDEQLVRQLRAEIDELVKGVPDAPPGPPPVTDDGTSERRWMPIAVAAISIAVLVGGLIVIANRDADEATTDVPPTEPPAPTTIAPPGTTAPQVPQRYETVGTVLESAEHGPELCLGGVAESYPPQCGGPSLVGWSWELVEGEQSANGTTWVEAYLVGTWDPSAHTFTVTSARLAEGADRERLQAAPNDFSVPCTPPEGGWPARNQEWPGEQIAAIEGYAGAWVDASEVMTVKFAGDLETAEAAVRQYYSDALCVVPAAHTEAELLEIQGQLMAMSSVQFLWSSVVVDATGEWVEAGVIAPDPERQAAFDAEWGPGVVRLVSQLHPM